MITREDVERLRARLREVLREDSHNAERVLARLGSLAHEAGIGPHAAVLLALTRSSFEEAEARSHWEVIVERRRSMSKSLGRDVGLRVAALDYFAERNRQATEPARIDLEMLLEWTRSDGDDPRTGLAGDRMLRSFLAGELRRARRYRQSVAVVAFDLDNFAAAARDVGPLVADRLLRECAIIISNQIRDIDLAARPGEDEFALVLPQTGRTAGLLVAERVRRGIEAHFSRREAGGQVVGLTASGGVAAYPEDATAPEDVLSCAAQALYGAKAGGKNAVLAFHPERRRFLRFDLEPGRFEVEVLRPGATGGPAGNVSRNGIVFASPEALDVGEEIEIRLLDRGEDEAVRPLRARGRVVRLEELPADASPPSERYEIGVAFQAPDGEGGIDPGEFLERALARGPGDS